MSETKKPDEKKPEDTPIDKSRQDRFTYTDQDVEGITIIRKKK